MLVVSRGTEASALLRRVHSVRRLNLSVKILTESGDGQEEAVRGIDPSGTIEGRAAGGNDVVDVGMMFKVLSPRMEHAEESDVRFEMLRIACQFKHRCGAGAEKQIVKQPLVL